MLYFFSFLPKKIIKLIKIILKYLSISKYYIIYSIFFLFFHLKYQFFSLNLLYRILRHLIYPNKFSLSYNYKNLHIYRMAIIKFRKKSMFYQIYFFSLINFYNYFSLFIIFMVFNFQKSLLFKFFHSHFLKVDKKVNLFL